MTDAELIAQARAQLTAMEMSEKSRVFLLQALDLTLPKPIHSIDISRTWSGVKFSVFYEDGDERQFEATPPKPKES